jgi:sugar/nucleoside kinase (ribokinase family)
MPELFVNYSVDCARARDPLFLRNLMRSTFICYGAPDAVFARLLRDRLHRNGVDTFFLETDAVPGTKLHHLMRDEVNNHDRVIVICSQASLERAGVRNEIEETLAREARDGGESYLILVALDTFVYVWQDPLARAIRDRVIGDFSDAPADTPKFRSSFQLLLQALKKN